MSNVLLLLKIQLFAQREKASDKISLGIAILKVTVSALNKIQFNTVVY